MKYAVLVYETSQDFADRDDDAKKAGYWGAHSVYAQALRDQGIAAGGAGLLPPRTATTLRQRGGSRQVVDGPYADTKEQLGGFYLIDVPDLDAALAWAQKCPSITTGSVEVRPLIEM